MNKFAKFMVVLAMTLCLAAVPAFAATSMSNTTEVTGGYDETGGNVEITVGECDGPVLTEEIAAAVINEVVAAGGNVVGGSTTVDRLEVIWQKCLKSDVLPVTITFHAAGTAGLPLYVFHWNGESWDLMASDYGEDIAATFDNLSPVGLVVKKPLSNPNGTTSDKTGTTSTIAIALGIALVAGAAAVVIYRKKVQN